MNATAALAKLKAGNRRYVEKAQYSGEIGEALRAVTTAQGQRPYAIVIGCSDSRAIPEVIFDAGIGELFVIRVAGNVMDSHQMGSVEYAAEHLGTRLVVVLGHTHCGAVDAALHHDPDGHIKYITDDIKEAIGEERNPDKACELNVRHSVATIRGDAGMAPLLADGLVVLGAVYDIERGTVAFLE